MKWTFLRKLKMLWQKKKLLMMSSFFLWHIFVLKFKVVWMKIVMCNLSFIYTCTNKDLLKNYQQKLTKQWENINPFPHTTILQQTTLNVFCQNIENFHNWMDNLCNFFFCHYVFKTPSAAEAQESVYMRERINKINHAN